MAGRTSGLCSTMLFMNKEDAIKVLLQVAQMAQKGGLLSFKDSAITLSAIEALEGQATPTVDITPEEPKAEADPLAPTVMPKRMKKNR